MNNDAQVYVESAVEKFMENFLYAFLSVKWPKLLLSRHAARTKRNDRGRHAADLSRSSHSEAKQFKAIFHSLAAPVQVCILGPLT